MAWYHAMPCYLAMHGYSGWSMFCIISWCGIDIWMRMWRRVWSKKNSTLCSLCSWRNHEKLRIDFAEVVSLGICRSPSGSASKDSIYVFPFTCPENALGKTAQTAQKRTSDMLPIFGSKWQPVIQINFYPSQTIMTQTTPWATYLEQLVQFQHKHSSLDFNQKLSNLVMRYASIIVQLWVQRRLLDKMAIHVHQPISFLSPAKL